MVSTGCRFEGCTNKVKARSLCAGHYNQDQKGAELTPLMRYRKKPVAPEGYSFCFECEAFKRADDFYVRSGGTLAAECKRCYIELMTKHQQRRAAEARALRATETALGATNNSDGSNPSQTIVEADAA